MTDLMPFYFDRQQVRAFAGEDGEPRFVAADVCAILEIGEPRSALRRLSPSMKGVHTVHTPGGPQQVNIVNEAGLYKLVFTSRKPEAERFSDWVASAVLPEIRRTGRFNGSTDRLPTHLETAEALVEALRSKEKLEQQIEAERPKVEFHDRMARAEGDQTVDSVAKQLGTGEKRLFRALRSLGYLRSNNEPYQEWVNRGWFRSLRKTGRWAGREQVYRQTVITPKGLAGLYKDQRFRDLLPPVRQESLPGIGERPMLN